MLTIHLSDGSVLLIGHFISFLICASYLIFICMFMMKKILLDKVVHACICSVITFSMLNLLYLIDNDHWSISIIVAMAVGIGKEFVDLINKKKQKFDIFDIVADFVGTAVVISVYIFSFLLQN
jgi:hypothetical protein